MIYLFLVILGVVLIVFSLATDRKKNNYLEEYNKTIHVYSLSGDDDAVDFNTLSDRTLWQRVQDRVSNLKKQIGALASIKIILFVAVLLFAGNEINQRFLRGNLILIEVITVIIGLLFAYSWLQKRERTQFEEAFPDALNILASAVSSGESIMHAIMYVGKNLDGDVGAEFKVMGDRLQMGEAPDEVFRKSCKRFPYPSFYFFVITLRANMHRGGQLKDVITRLNRLMFDARAIDKKKSALTSEARISAKIVASIPFLFLLLMQYVSPLNYEFVMFSEEGRPILYYVLISEAIGMTIIAALLKGVR
ncbi:type II secretion system F family protein [Vibrio sp. VB16]|uniref:type II secretion system F family protein n=1 Tax=Vibrio sp. VB16 TaxID=2785746 RepID=UPI00189DCD4B|nr:type II secretion system F family protein [Vibrio sp. VB16]UGA54216.1 type II secretion system F family protein [Vibrio sp. VB16]